ncbi:hypothetical protein Aargi30884_01820 [Amedibacterium intestinale]|uniref:Lipoprotein n=1 Tax=Amedibacterium intestinale TaxID=2583452 RepID=A0A6N4TEV3_9FIRM|nr:hypothetical protein [Amedibacterium intestinale]BBK21279.1 hypothetical protein Aargi30884_01820 [Amedibacterium intestinale]
MKKKILAISLLCILLSGCSFSDTLNKLSGGDDKKASNDISKMDTSYKSVEAVVKEVLTKIKSGKTSDDYMKKLDSIKKYLSEDAYLSLTPEDSDQTENESLQKFDEEYIATTEIKDIQTALIPVSSRKVTAITLYTLRTEAMGETSSMAYCMKSELQLTGNEWKISKIYFDNALQS